MKKQNQTPVATITSFKDAAYQSAKSSETMASVAEYVLEKCPSFLDSVPDEVSAELIIGWALRWQ